MRKSIATVSLSGTLDEKLAAAARVGFDGVEIFENDLISSYTKPPEVRQLAEDLGLTIDLYQPFRDFEAVPAELFARNLERAERKFDIMEQLGTTTMLVCSSVSSAAIGDDDLAAAQLYELADHASRHGIYIAYEALAWGRHVRDYRHAYDIVAAADHPHLGTCLDSFHILSRGDDPAAIADIPGEKIAFLQLADAPQLMMDVLQWSRHYRCFPGQGGFDLPTFLEKVVAAGYRGPLSLEVFNDVFRQANSTKTATDAMRSLLHLEESLRCQLASSVPEATPSGDSVQTRSRVELFDPPPPAALQGYAFAELGVGPEMAAETATLLSALGFVEAGQHSSKPVTLWRQGSLSMLLNPAAGNTWDAACTPSQTWLAALGVLTNDAVQAANRAEALRTPILPRRRGPGEVDLPAVQAPDGSALLLCDANEDSNSWVTDFDISIPEGTEQPLLTHVDHLALAVSFDQFDESVLFFRSVLGLRPQESMEIADPYGLVRSRALTNRDQTLRIALNVSQLGHRPATDIGLQHIAFACDDIFATARALRARGLPYLPIPDNYYDDLAARWELPDEFVTSLRELDILYDRSADGEFYHLYTQTLGHRLFFEIVQRISGYTGYGAANTPVRMAAQRQSVTGHNNQRAR